MRNFFFFNQKEVAKKKKKKIHTPTSASINRFCNTDKTRGGFPLVHSSKGVKEKEKNFKFKEKQKAAHCY